MSGKEEEEEEEKKEKKKEKGRSKSNNPHLAGGEKSTVHAFDVFQFPGSTDPII